MSRSIHNDLNSSIDFRLLQNDQGALKERKVENSSKWKPLFVVLVILGVGGFVVVGVGFGGLGASQSLWSAGLLNHLGQINSIVMMTTGTVITTLSFISGILVQIKTSTPYVFSNENAEEVPLESSESTVSTAPVEEKKFSENDLSCFLTALRIFGISKRLRVKVEEKTYAISYKASSLKIQEVKFRPETMEILLNEENEIDSVRMQGKEIADIPEIYVEILEKGLETLLQVTSSYRSTTNYAGMEQLTIKVLRDSIKKIPEFHLQKFIQKLPWSKSFDVEFHNDALGTNEAADAGGPSRDYLGTLFEAVICSPLFCFEKLPSGFVVPRTTSDYENGNSLPGLTEDEQWHYLQIGQLLMSFFDHEQYLRDQLGTQIIGRQFEDSFFKALLCLTSDEIDTPFEELSLATKLKISSALLTDAKDEAIYMERINLLHKDRLTDEDLAKAAQIACFAECLPDDLVDNDAPILEKIKSEENHERVLKALEASLFGAKASFGQLGPLLAPVHIIARGMKERCCNPREDNPNIFWDAYVVKIDFRKFSNSIQGLISREDIISRIRFYEIWGEDANKEIAKKVEWLKEWILDSEKGATDEELRELLKFITGSKSLPAGVYISVESQRNYRPSPVPIAHTCRSSFELAPRPSGNPEGCNDHTKENFIKTLRETVLVNNENYALY